MDKIAIPQADHQRMRKSAPVQVRNVDNPICAAVPEAPMKSSDEGVFIAASPADKEVECRYATLMVRDSLPPQAPMKGSNKKILQPELEEGVFIAASPVNLTMDTTATLQANSRHTRVPKSEEGVFIAASPVGY
ncbi:hypothetical protein AX17_006000 [Amanita inopinata Kibby_2008]|nr:hypothetical protein AX17_006000 [Amanita inopinata Kibby_2008]